MPMSDARYLRLQTIRPRLSHAIKGISADVEILHRLSSSGAISNTDFSEIDSQRTEYRKSFLLITAIMRRSNRAYDLFKKTLIEAKREHLAVYLNEG